MNASYALAASNQYDPTADAQVLVDRELTRIKHLTSIGKTATFGNAVVGGDLKHTVAQSEMKKLGYKLSDCGDFLLISWGPKRKWWWYNPYADPAFSSQ